MIPDLSGKTKIIGLLGYPVSHSLSPAMHNAAFQKAGLDFVYVCFPVKPEELGKAINGIRTLNIAGVNITVPHKSAAIPYVDEVSEEAKKIGAINTIVNREGRLFAYNTDVNGFWQSLENEGISLKGARVVMLGAGGVARAFAVGTILKNAASLAISDIIPKKAEELVQDVKSMASDAEIVSVTPDSSGFKELLGKAGLIINATPLGMKPDDPFPFTRAQWDAVRSSTVIFDAVYNLKGTQLQKAAQEKGIAYISGIEMLLFQGVRAFELWTGVRPDALLMKKVLQEKLA